MLRLSSEIVADLKIHQITKNEPASRPNVQRLGRKLFVSPLLLMAVPDDVLGNWIHRVQFRKSPYFSNRVISPNISVISLFMLYLLKRDHESLSSLVSLLARALPEIFEADSWH
jgi:hypothetical protein